MLFFGIESAAALAVSLFINVCVVSVFAKGFYDKGIENIGLENAGKFLGDTFGASMVRLPPDLLLLRQPAPVVPDKPLQQGTLRCAPLAVRAALPLCDLINVTSFGWCLVRDRRTSLCQSMRRPCA